MEVLNRLWSPLFDLMEVGLVISDQNLQVKKYNSSFESHLNPKRWDVSQPWDLRNIFYDPSLVQSLIKNEDKKDRSFFAELLLDSDGKAFAKIQLNGLIEEKYFLWSFHFGFSDVAEMLSLTPEATMSMGHWTLHPELKIVQLDKDTKDMLGIRDEGKDFPIDLLLGMVFSDFPGEELMDFKQDNFLEKSIFNKELGIKNRAGIFKRLWIFGSPSFNNTKLDKIQGIVVDLTRLYKRSDNFNFLTDQFPGFFMHIFSNPEGEEWVSFFGKKFKTFFSMDQDRQYDVNMFWERVFEPDRIELLDKIDNRVANSQFFNHEFRLYSPEGLISFHSRWTSRSVAGSHFWDVVFLEISNPPKGIKEPNTSDPFLKSISSIFEGFILILNSKLTMVEMVSDKLGKYDVLNRDLVGKSLEEFFMEDERQSNLARIQSVNEGIRFNTGTIKLNLGLDIIGVELFPLTFNEDNQPEKYMAIDSEAVERTTNSNSLFSIEYNKTLTQSNEVGFDWDLTSDRIRWAGKMEGFLDFTFNQSTGFSGKIWEQLIHPDDLKLIVARRNSALINTQCVIGKLFYRMLTSKRTCFHVMESSLILRDNLGKATRILGNISTARYPVENRPHFAKKNFRFTEFRQALDLTTNIILTDLQGNILEVNQNTCNLSGFTKEELIGSNSRINKSGHHSPEFYAEMWQTIKSGNVWRGEIKNKRKDNSTYWVDTTIIPLKDSNHIPYQFLAIRVDITEQKTAQEKVLASLEKVKLSEKRYSHLFNKSPIPMWVYEGRTLEILDVNEAAISKYGYSRTSFLKLKLTDLFSNDQLIKFDQLIFTTLYEKCTNPQKFLHKKRSGEEIKVEVCSIPLNHGPNSNYLMVSNDITQVFHYLDKIESQNKILKEIAWTQSHIVRAPLARIMGIINLVHEGVLEDHELIGLLPNILSSALELDNVIRDISDKASYLGG